MSRLRPLTLAAAAAVLGAAGTAFALSPEEIMKLRKTPAATVAMALPMAESPPGYCEAVRAGWMYFDVKMRDAGAIACVCVQGKDLTWQWVSFGGLVRECD
ncbi:MAG: hypothetical protein EXR71_05090 [Myxococcales bacterium]|nr:hypothetical protein [Myxococcales bacterium]